MSELERRKLMFDLLCGQVLIVKSDLLGEEVAFVGDKYELETDKWGRWNGRVVYRWSELCRIIETGTTPSALKAVHEVKRWFGGQIVA